MKENILWAKTLLTTYKYLERISGAIDKILMEKALSAGGYSCGSDAQGLLENMIDISERKVTLINMKVLVESVLEGMRKTDALLLVDRFCNRMKCNELMEKYNISMRSVFRKSDVALVSFSKRMCDKGFNAQKLSQVLRNESWILSVFHRFERKEEDFSLSGATLERAAIRG